MSRKSQVAIVVAVMIVALVAWWKLRGRGEDTDTAAPASGGSGSVVAEASGGTARRPGPIVPASVSV